MDNNDIPLSTLQTILKEEVQALRSFLSLLAEQEQALLTNQLSSNPSLFREAKNKVSSIQRRREQSLNKINISEDNDLFKQWLVENDDDCDILPLWEQLTSLIKKVSEQEEKNAILGYRQELSPVQQRSKKQSKIDTLDS